MSKRVAFIGFGEAGQAFAGAAAWSGPARAYDRLTDSEATRSAKLDDYVVCSVEPTTSLEEALCDAELVLSLVTADQALGVARSAISLEPGVLYCDLNSVAPATKQAAAEAVERHGGRYVDVAIMSPVNPARLSAPLLLSGPAAPDALEALTTVGFVDARVIGGSVGDASAVKMIRSVIVKGIEALTAEAMHAAANARVADEVLASLDASERPMPWQIRADYNLDRIMVHGGRRAAEMEEAARTLQSLGVEPLLTRATVTLQREIGRRSLQPQHGLESKLRQLWPGKAEA